MLKSIELNGFKSFGRKSELSFTSPIAAIVGPNGSGKSNVAEAFRFVLGEQSMRSLRSKKGEDLIWGGSPGMPRSNRASVRVIFDNKAHSLALDFPEVIIERVVYRDGVNEYSINGSKVRLKDVTALLAQANVGSSGYHIISQGEADRVLSASPRERREMVEEALGLKAYQHKKAESEKKLEETDLNIAEAGLLRREIGPHLTYLRKQVERIEKAKELQDDLAAKLSDYLTRENAFITQEKARLSGIRHDLAASAESVARAVGEAEAALSLSDTASGDEHNAQILATEHQLVAARTRREEVSRALGRAEGELAALRASAVRPASPAEAVSAASVIAFSDALERGIARALQSDDRAEIASALAALQEMTTSFRGSISAGGSGTSPSSADQAITDVALRVEDLTRAFSEAQDAEARSEALLADLRESITRGREAYHAAERALIEKRAEAREIASKRAQADARLAQVQELRERFEEEVREGIVLIGAATLSFESDAIPEGALSEDRHIQEDRRRAIERLKIKIEEYRGGNVDEVMREYTETRERDDFLAREIADLERSAASLRAIIEELEMSIDERFKSGLSLIRTEFNTFFTELFGGGQATLDLERARAAEEGSGGEDAAGSLPSDRAGLSVSVQLPRKQARGLEVLSGGERALTSIALIFAMSQVNPPPFLILDETDAALDEANSRRYASIVETLAKRSQLILITHNRATMSAAGELYGVTMGQDGVSKLLSVKLDEAVMVAK
jgi:chromosome segregation ATPase